MNSAGLKRFLQYYGYRAKEFPSRGFSGYTMKELLKSDHRIALKVNCRGLGQDGWHWVRLEGFRCTRGKDIAIIGDPWTGRSWEVPTHALLKRTDPGAGVVVAKLG